MARHFEGELIYNQEVDEHPPYLTVGQTLEFAAAMRTPRARLPHITRKDRIKHVVEVMLSVFGLSHTRNTIVGNDCVRGVSGGERKRVSIAETALSEAAISHGIILPAALMPNLPYILFVGYGRSVVRKQASYVFYRPSAEVLASVIVDIPVKLVVGSCFNIIMYFLSVHATTASQFFIFFLSVFETTLAMSMVFRTIAAVTGTLPQAMAISGFLVLAMVTYTGFVLPDPYMHPWFKWISYINPLSYAFEALLVNQANGTNYPCSHLVPPYPNLTDDTFICPVLVLLPVHISAGIGM
ncbi:ATPase [Fusarium oxysporum f. sp. conglutinans race 2 54008]|uniref:ABC-2 type transporter transmembrane domain-containing protein n=2 Tax=Fusarium oxysporum f. sp. conglutinans TaxID=100902 RepID=A0A8H6H201_FUSOX|nr:ATPase [Fusarium oxysporum f. sp. conglutinans race 2 54008]KAF6527614.1 hypothetical protein HZS61_007916 [Fusarium oxysporum f. sp. conglutinans]KAF6527650.1 hypothetical protein HZS61_007952 [Fusarium oxysporum f. sp. conglutinans]